MRYMLYTNKASLSILKSLVALGNDPSIRDKYGWTLFDISIRNYDHFRCISTEVVEFLIDNQAGDSNSALLEFLKVISHD